MTESYYVTGKSPKLQESNSIMLPTLKRTVNSGVFQTGVLVLIILFPALVNTLPALSQAS